MRHPESTKKIREPRFPYSSRACDWKKFLVPDKCASNTKEMQTARKPNNEGIRMVEERPNHGRLAGTRQRHHNLRLIQTFVTTITPGNRRFRFWEVCRPILRESKKYFPAS